MAKKKIVSEGVYLIAVERWRQVEKEGWTAAHDDEHTCQEMVRAAMAYASIGLMQSGDMHPKFAGFSLWPWHWAHWKPSDDHIRNLVKAGALIAAEIDRLKRQQQKQNGEAKNGR